MISASLWCDEKGRNVYDAPCCGGGIAVAAGDWEKLCCIYCFAFLRQRGRVIEVIGRRVRLEDKIGKQRGVQ